MGRYAAVDDGIGTNFYVITDFDRADDLGAGTQKDMIAEDRGLFFVGPDGNEVLDVNIAAAPDGAIDDDPVAVDKYETRSELCAAAYDAAAEECVCLIAEHSKRGEMVVLRGLHQPVHDHRKGSIRQAGLEDGAYRGLAI